MEFAMDIYAREMLRGITFVAQFGLSLMYAGVHKNGKGYIVIVRGFTWLPYEIIDSDKSPEKIANHIAASMMMLIEQGSPITDFIPAEQSINTIIRN
jgi:hypothetical protein